MEGLRKELEKLSESYSEALGANGESSSQKQLEPKKARTGKTTFLLRTLMDKFVLCHKVRMSLTPLKNVF